MILTLRINQTFNDTLTFTKRSITPLLWNKNTEFALKEKLLNCEENRWRRNKTVLSFHCLFLARECPWIINRSFPAFFISRKFKFQGKLQSLSHSPINTMWTLPIHSSSPNTGKIVSLKRKLWTRKCEKICGKTEWIWKCLEICETKNYWKN
jgi:hypothetical protein